MQEEIKKISDEKLIDDTFFYLCFKAIDEAKKYYQELLKRLSKNNITLNFYSPEEIFDLKNSAISEFKKKLIKEIEKNNCIMGKKMIYDLINNIGKEK